MDYVYIPDPNLKAAINYQLNPSRLPEQDITDSEMLSLTKLNASSRGIVDLTGLQKAVNLEWIYLFGNKIGNLEPLKPLIKLEYLWLSNNELSDITPLSSLTNLLWLYLDGNKIDNIFHLGQLTKLDNLGLSNNKIVNLEPISNLTKLDNLGLLNNKINDIYPLASLRNLKYLTLYRNQITDITPIKWLTNLRWLDLSENQINNLAPLRSLTVLDTLYLVNNKISDISEISNLINLSFLVLSHNEINNLFPLGQLSKLKILGLEGNQISEISPLGLLYQLSELGIADNKVRTIEPLSKLTNLKSLDLSTNYISDLWPLSKLINLEWLKLSYNEISDLSPIGNLKISKYFNAENQTIITKGNWSNGTLTILTTILKNENGSSPDTISNINPSSGVYDSVRKTVTWSPIDYNTEASFNFVGENTFSGVVIREGNTGPKALQLQLSGQCKTLINYQQPIIFNKTIYSNAIKYDSNTGTITFTSSGLYSINWWVAGMESGYIAVFAVKVVGGEQIIGNANNNPGQVSGSAIIEVITAPMEIQLVNLTTRCGQPAWVMLSNEVPVQANISIVDYFNYSS